jgi:hypothetical protein
MTNLQPAAIRLHNAAMTLQVVSMAQNDPNDPKNLPPIETAAEPPPLVRMEVPPEEQEDFDWSLYDAEEQSKKLPASFVNRAYAKIEARHLRISFGERVGDEDIYRSTILMTPEDAYELGQLLIRQSQSAYGLVLDHYRQVLESLPPKEEPNG